MMMPKPTTGPQLDPSPDTLREEWLARLADLIGSVRGWAERSGWKSREITKAMDDSVLGAYRAPALLLQREAVEVILNPVARFVPGADGAVDLYLIPGYDDIASLYLSDGSWTIHHPIRAEPGADGDRDPLVMSLSEAAIVRVLDDIASHAT